jgi:hypothetical protein
VQWGWTSWAGVREWGRLAPRLDSVYPAVHISSMAKARKTQAKTPRKQHPFLVGCTLAEAKIIKKNAKLSGVGPTTYMRMLALGEL